MASRLPALLDGHGSLYLAEEHMSYTNSWHEGAVRSAHDLVERIAGSVRDRAR
jgi:monoamine oxidase